MFVIGVVLGHVFPSTLRVIEGLPDMSTLDLFLEGIRTIGQLTVSPIPLEALPDANGGGNLLLDFLKFWVGRVILLDPAAGAVLLAIVD